jgi:hypothetical protein
LLEPLEQMEREPMQKRYGPRVYDTFLFRVLFEELQPSLFVYAPTLTKSNDMRSLIKETWVRRMNSTGVPHQSNRSTGIGGV